MGKKGRTGQKKVQGPKAKAKQFKIKQSRAKAKVRKAHSKPVKTNIKKMASDNRQKIASLNADITKVLMAPPKLKPTPKASTSKTRPPVEDQEMPDVGSVESKLAAM